MSRSQLLLLLLCAAPVACVPNNALNEEALARGELLITCDIDADCPGSLVCATNLGQCVPLTSTGSLRLLEAVGRSERSVVLTFNEALNPPSVGSVTSYTITDASGAELAIEGAAPFDDGGERVQLFVGEQKPGAAYTVTVSNLVGAAGQRLDEEATSASFVGYGVVPDSTPPLALTPKQHEGVRGPTVRVIWAPVLGANTFTVNVFTRDATGDVTPIVESVELPATQTFYDVEGLTDDIAYYWSVRADVTEGDVPVNAFDLLASTAYVFCDGAHACTADADNDGDGAPDPEAGSRSTPFRSIERAMRAAFAHDLSEVWVARRGGDAAYEERVRVQSGVSLRGGWDALFETQDVGSPSRIVGDMHALSVSDAFETTVVEGLYVEAGLLPLEISTSSAALVVRDCVLHARGDDGYAMGVRMGMSYPPAPVLERLTIVAEGAFSAMGLNVTDGGHLLDLDVTVRSSVADGQALGVLADNETLVLFGSRFLVEGPASVKGALMRLVVFRPPAAVAAPTPIMGNRFEVRNTSSGAAIGVELDNAFVDLSNNLFMVEASVGYGITVKRAPIGMVWLSNNLVTVTADHATGLVVEDSPAHLNQAAVVLAHNTVLSRGVSTRHVGIDVVRSEPVLTNNVFASTGATYTNGLYQTGALTPLSLHNNVLSGFVEPYVDGTGTWTVTFEPCTGRGCDDTPQVSGNVTDAELSALFVDANDEELDGLLPPEGSAIAGTGKPTDDKSCGIAGTEQSCGARFEWGERAEGISSDIFGRQRLNPPTPGAFEVF